MQYQHVPNTVKLVLGHQVFAVDTLHPVTLQITGMQNLKWNADM